MFFEMASANAPKSRAYGSATKIHSETIELVERENARDLEEKMRLMTLGKTPNQNFGDLSSEIWEYFQKNGQTTTYLEKKLHILGTLTNILNQIYVDIGTKGVNVKLIPFGSSVSGLGCKDSDVDVTLLWTTKRCKNRAKRLRFFERKLVEERYQRMLRMTDIEVVGGSVSILRLNAYNDLSKEMIPLDINIMEWDGLQNSVLLREYSRMDDRLAPLVLVLKEWAEQRGILSASTGYLSSLSLTLMLVHYLQNGEIKPVLPNLQAVYPELLGTPKKPPTYEQLLRTQSVKMIESKNSKNVGQLLFSFFEYFKGIDFNNVVITVNKGLLKVEPRDRKQNNQNCLLIVRDPYHIRKATSRSVKSPQRLEEIVSEFNRAHQVLLSGGGLAELGL